MKETGGFQTPFCLHRGLTLPSEVKEVIKGPCLGSKLCSLGRRYKEVYPMGREFRVKPFPKPLSRPGSGGRRGRSGSWVSSSPESLESDVILVSTVTSTNFKGFSSNYLSGS